MDTFTLFITGIIMAVICYILFVYFSGFSFLSSLKEFFYKRDNKFCCNCDNQIVDDVNKCVLDTQIRNKFASKAIYEFKYCREVYCSRKCHWKPRED